ncbi:phage terminase large subunit [Anaerosolibacter sp.]|uniref:phage terminase large subunit n=1 Tax=Anaerosolibacter sp. TaxID=1872527 RepID=UPI0039F1468B
MSGYSILNELISDKQKLEPRYLEAQESFWAYCKLMNPKFFKDSRQHLRRIADTLQAQYEGRIIKLTPESDWMILSLEEIEDLICSSEPEVMVDYIVCRKLMLNVPPRHGKSYIVSLFAQWMFGKNNENRVITVTYNETLSSRFSANVRDGIDATKLDLKLNIFSDVFPGTKIKQGDGSKQIWALEGQFFNYLGTGFGGTITGIGCRIGIIDDPVKNAEEAFNDRVLENQWSWYTDTFLSRIEEGGMQIIIMTRWSTKDLCGRLLSSEEAGEWYELKMKACLDEENGIMLAPELLSFKSYMSKKRLTSPEIHEANYQQEPVDVQGRLYSSIKLYRPNELPAFERIMAYVDTADTGTDSLCVIVSGVSNGEAYILDVYYTDKPMEITESATAKILVENNVNLAVIESNNGGRGFSRNVERIIWEKYKTRKVVIKWFHQSQNKIARILSNSTFVMEHIYFPYNWNIRWPEFYQAISTYQAKGKNKHDDAADALTGVAESISQKKRSIVDRWRR